MFRGGTLKDCYNGDYAKVPDLRKKPAGPGQFQRLAQSGKY
jgi:hypothetical protein